jgi:hypothetical protein
MELLLFDPKFFFENGCRVQGANSRAGEDHFRDTLVTLQPPRNIPGILFTFFGQRPQIIIRVFFEVPIFSVGMP